MIILGVESSCDETSLALVKDGKEIIDNLVSSQIDVHAQYGGVVPEVASRKHTEIINQLFKQLIERNNLTKDDIEAISVTFAPGLQGSLLVGLSFAKTLAWLWSKPLIGVNHLEGHIYSAFLDYDIKPPFVVLLVSGGHTELIEVIDHGKYKLIGKTKDDAVGEAFDKVARLLDLSYPGGPIIDKLSKKGNDKAFNFPSPMPSSLDFSFSGLKTAVLYKVRDLKEENIELPVEDLCASFSKTVSRNLVKKTIKATKKVNYNQIVVTGGVAANSTLREHMKAECLKNDFVSYFPKMSLCTDNAAMIACVGYYKYIRGDYEKDSLLLEAKSRLPVYG